MKIAEIKAERRQQLIKEKAIKNTKESIADFDRTHVKNEMCDKAYKNIFNAFAKEIDRDELRPALSIVGVYPGEQIAMVKLKFPGHKSVMLRIEFENRLLLEPKVESVHIENEAPIPSFSLGDILIMAEEEND